MTSAARERPHPSRDPTLIPTPWSERAWVRALRGGRGRPLGALLLAAAILLAITPPLRPLRALRFAAFDAYQILGPRPRVSAPAVVVEIDEASLARHGQWPWPRTLLARLLARIGEGRPAAVGVDIVMPEPDRFSPGRLPALVEGLDADLAARLSRLPSHDTVLAKVLRDMPAVLGVVGLDAADPATTTTAGPSAPVRAMGVDPGPFVRRFAALLRSVPELDQAAPGHGLLNVDAEGGVVRRLPLVAAVGPTLFPALGLEVLRLAAHQPAFAVRTGPGGVEAVSVGDLVIPTQPDGSVWLRFGGHDPARFVSAGDVLSGAADPRLFAQKLVLVGATAVGLSDWKPTPVADAMAGIEIHAQLLESVFDGTLLVRPGWAAGVEVGLLLAGGLLLVLVVPDLRAWSAAGLFIALAGAALGGGFLLYLLAGHLLDAATPTLGLSLVFVAMLAVSLAETDSHRRALARQLAQEREAAARLAGELEAARRIQMGILPRAADAFPGERRVSVYASVETARLVGGDLYDFFRLDGERLFFLIGDVSGKGLPAALFMALSKSLCRSAALRTDGDLGRLMREANGEIARDNAESLFVSAVAAVLDVRAGSFAYVNAGHEPPYLLSRGAAAPRPLTAGGGPPLCVLDDYPYRTASEALAPGDTLCLVTDGVTEAQDGAETLYGRARLEALLAGLGAAGTVEAVGEAIRADVQRFEAGADPADDLAVLVIRWHGPTGADRPQ